MQITTKLVPPLADDLDVRLDAAFGPCDEATADLIAASMAAHRLSERGLADARVIILGGGQVSPWMS